jgi:hypothetical protein
LLTQLLLLLLTRSSTSLPQITPPPGLHTQHCRQVLLLLPLLQPLTQMLLLPLLLLPLLLLPLMLLPLLRSLTRMLLLLLLTRSSASFPPITSPSTTSSLPPLLLLSTAAAAAATTVAHPLIRQLASDHVSLHHQQLAATLGQRSSKRLAIRKVQLHKLDVGQSVGC